MTQCPSIDMETFAIRLRSACYARNISARDLKNYLHLGSVQAVYLWLNGQRLPNLDNLYAISKYLDIPIDFLLVNERYDKVIDILTNDHLPMHGKRVLTYWTQLHKEK